MATKNQLTIQNSKSEHDFFLLFYCFPRNSAVECAPIAVHALLVPEPRRDGMLTTQSAILAINNGTKDSRVQFASERIARPPTERW